VLIQYNIFRLASKVTVFINNLSAQPLLGTHCGFWHIREHLIGGEGKHPLSVTSRLRAALLSAALAIMAAYRSAVGFQRVLNAVKVSVCYLKSLCV